MKTEKRRKVRTERREVKTFHLSLFSFQFSPFTSHLSLLTSQFNPAVAFFQKLCFEREFSVFNETPTVGENILDEFGNRVFSVARDAARHALARRNHFSADDQNAIIFAFKQFFD